MKKLKLKKTESKAYVWARSMANNLRYIKDSLKKSHIELQGLSDEEQMEAKEELKKLMPEFEEEFEKLEGIENKHIEDDLPF